MKKQNKQTDALKKVTIVFGYSLFFLLLIALTISTIIPMSQLFFNPVARHFNVAILLISLVAGAVLPLLVSYIIGDRATHSKSKIDHHFNGVLFGIASYWLSTFFSTIGSDIVSDIRSEVSEPLATTIITGWPVLATLVVMSAVAVSYVKNQKKQSSLLEYKPYQLVLFTGLIATLAYSILNIYLNSSAVWVVPVLYVAVPLALIGISYIVLPDKSYNSSVTRLAAAVVAVTFGFITVQVAAQLLPPLISYNEILPIIVGVMGIVSYLLLARRAR